jgi:hypothetical protein
MMEQNSSGHWEHHDGTSTSGTYLQDNRSYIGSMGPLFEADLRLVEMSGRRHSIYHRTG